MKFSYLLTILIAMFLFVTYFSINHNSASHTFRNDLIQEKEIRFSNLRQLTFSGENAEAYFSSNGKKLIFQNHDGNSLCEQIYIMNIETGSTNMVSTGEGVTTCSYFVYPDCQKAIYASTHMGNKKCPEKPDYSMGYVWRVYHPKTAEEIQQYKNLLAQNSIRPMALQIWTMNSDGTNKKQITNNGAANFGPYFFPSGNKIVFLLTYMIQKGEISTFTL